jgi:hypothetical protein
MVKTASLFSQLLAQIPRDIFARIVAKHGGEKHAKGFTCWHLTVAMLFAHLARADSLREICDGLRTVVGKLVHLGIRSSTNKSTLSYANQHRPAAILEELWWTMLDDFRKRGQLGVTKKFRFKAKVSILDSTTISLCHSLFPWADYRKVKGGVKLHVLLEPSDAMPDFIHISEARQHDVKFAQCLSLKPGTFVVLDRGYMDLALFSSWHEQGVFFVTRLKDNAAYRIVEAREVKAANVLSDRLIEFTGYQSGLKCPYTFRCVEVWDEKNQRFLDILTNNLKLSASSIAQLYRQRWQIEVFFKTIKQTLKIKSFLGTSENALRIQIWTAMIALLLLRWLHFLSKARWSLSNLASMLRINLFSYRDLLEWLDDPFQTPPLEPSPSQLALPLPGLGQLTAG